MSYDAIEVQTLCIVVVKCCLKHAILNSKANCGIVSVASIGYSNRLLAKTLGLSAMLYQDELRYRNTIFVENIPQFRPFSVNISAAMKLYASHHA